MLFIGLLFVPTAHAQASRLSLSFNEDFPAPRDLFKEFKEPKKSTVSSLLLRTKKAIEDQHFKTCLIKISALKSKAPQILNWLETEEVLCRYKQFKKDNKNQAQPLWSLLKRLYGKGALKSKDPHSKLLVKRWQKASLELFHWQERNHPQKAWANFEQLQNYISDLETKEKARLFSYAGELSLKKGDEKTAVDFWGRSIGFQENPRLKKKLDRLRKKLKLPMLEEEQDLVTVKPPMASEEEESLYSRFRQAVKSKDHIAAVSDGIEIINLYPGSKNADRAAKQILSVYMALATSKKDEWQLIKARVLELMKKAAPFRILEWATFMNDREYFQDALVLAEDRLDDVKGQPLAAKVLLLVGSSYLHIGEFSEAEAAFSNIVSKHSGSKAWPEAIFKLAIISYRLKKYENAEKYFTKYLKIDDNEDYNLSSHYWLWRSLQKLNSDEEEDAREALLKRYPVSYYGIRAILEKNSGQLKYPKGTETQNWKLDLSLTSSEKKSWERAKILISGSWFEEARRELKSLPTPKDDIGKLVWARTWAAVLNYPNALKLVGEVWEKNEKLVNRRVLELIYPKEFIDIIGPYAKRYRQDPRLILALIRQESSFLYNVKSWAGALGVMQIMSATGREVARDLRIRNFSPRRDLLKPRVNVKIGTNYLYRLNKAFNGHIPLSLAAYNAGIGNIRAWMKSRTDLNPDEMSGLDPDSELWLEELPWLETSGYVKNILRNWVVYRYLDQSAEKIGVPVWKLSP